MIKSRRIRLVGLVALMGKMNTYRFWWERQKESDHWEDLDVSGG
jgi:hypothetical protein